MLSSPPPSMSGRLCTVPGSKHALFEAGDLDSASALIFVGGLTDGLTSVGYTYGLAEVLKRHNWSCVFVTLSSSYTQYGLGSLKQDALEIGRVVTFLKSERGKTRVVLQGHSTGCQDAMHYCTVEYATRPSINGAILQAPVSDVEYFEANASPEAKRWLMIAQAMVAAGKGEEWLPKEGSLASGSLTGQPVPFSIYRFTSLNASGGDDDFFSSTIPEDDLQFRHASVPLLLLLGGNDETYPPFLTSVESKQELLERWSRGSSGKVSDLSQVITGASHAVDDPAAREVLYSVILSFLERI